jgi:hypothetical protein
VRTLFSRAMGARRARFEVCDCASVDPLKRNALKHNRAANKVMRRRSKFVLRRRRLRSGDEEFLGVFKVTVTYSELSPGDIGAAVRECEQRILSTTVRVMLGAS